MIMNNSLELKIIGSIPSQKDKSSTFAVGSKRPASDCGTTDSEDSIKLTKLNDDPDTEVVDEGLRSGKWTNEEDDYSKRLISEFTNGTLNDCEDGCTLRAYLAKKLNCAPMRISKKFAGLCIGKVIFNFIYV